MKVNVKSLKSEIKNLNRIIEDYENIYLNLYNEFSKSSFFWNDINAKNFYRDLSVEKINVKETIDELYSLTKLYKYIVNQYEQIGNNIYYDLSNKHIILNNIKNYQQRLRVIVNKFYNLDTSSCSQITNYIIDERRKINNSLELINSVYKKVNALYKKLEEIDREVKIRVSKIEIEYIKENNIEDYV